MAPIKAAVIGVGSIGNNHARIYHDLPDVDLVGISDVNESLAGQVADRYTVPFTTDYRHLLATYQPDLVSICVPTVHHYEVAKTVIEHSVHLLIEKPIAATVEQAKEVRDLAQSAGVKATVGHIERFNPAIIALKEHLKSGEIGQPFRIQARRMGPFPARIRDVGVIVDLATHDLDIVRYTLDTDIVRLFAETGKGINTDHEDTMDCVLRCANGVIGTLNINWLTPTKIRDLTITGSAGMFHANYLSQELYFYENDLADSLWKPMGVLMGVNEGRMIRHKIERVEPLKAELAHFVQCVRDDSEPLVSCDDGIKALLLSLSLVASGQTHQTLSDDALIP